MLWISSFSFFCQEFVTKSSKKMNKKKKKKHDDEADGEAEAQAVPLKETPEKAPLPDDDGPRDEVDSGKKAEA